MIKKHQEYLLINIGNEVGDGSVSDATFTKEYIKAVTRMREADIHVPLIIDGSSWGQDINKLQACGPAILEADPDHNLMFSAHLWWPYMYGHTKQEVIDELTESKDMELPLVIGEFANQWEETAQGQIPYKTIMEYCAKYEIGYLIWSWGPGNNPQKFLDMTTDGMFDTMQDWAKEMVFEDEYALANLAVKPASMLTGLPASKPSEPLPAGNLAQGKKVTYSSKESELYAGENVTDGNRDTRWASDSNSQTDWVCVDLGEQKDIDKVLIDWEAAYATQYQIQVSDDAKTWKEAYRTYNGKGGVEEIALDESARYVRVYCTQKFGYTWGYSIFELGIYGPESKLSASVAPTAVVFDKNPSKQADLVFTVDAKENTLGAVKNGSETLIKDSDYTLVDNTLTISKSYLATLEKGRVQFTLVYNQGVSTVINVAIGDTPPIGSVSNAMIAPSAAAFEKKAPSEVKVAMTLNDNTLTAILNGETALVEGEDYTVAHNEVIFSSTYLETLARGKYALTFVFNEGENAVLEVKVTNSAEKNSEVTPAEVTFDKYVDPESSETPTDVALAIKFNGNTLETVKLNGELLDAENYIVTEEGITLPASYLMSLADGSYVLNFQFSAGDPAEVQLIVEENVPVAKGAIQVELVSGSTTTTNSMNNTFKLQVTDESEFDLSKLTMRYYFTAEDLTIGQTCWVDNACIQYSCAPWYVAITSNITSEIVKMDIATETANSYIEFTFNSDDKLNKLGRMEIATRTANNNWSNFDQSNDFSYNDATKVALFYDGKLVSGSMPR